jgi:hypothetical protein
MSKIRLKPAEGRRVRLHDGRLMPAEGWEVEDDAIWQRRLHDGDVEVVTAAPAAPAAKEGKA